MTTPVSALRISPWSTTVRVADTRAGREDQSSLAYQPSATETSNEAGSWVFSDTSLGTIAKPMRPASAREACSDQLRLRRVASASATNLPSVCVGAAFLAG